MKGRRKRSWPPGPKGVSQDATPANPMTIQQRINRARGVADSEIVSRIAAAAERRTGRPRLIPLDAVIAGFVLHASGQPHTMTMAGLWRTLHELTPAQLESLGFPVGVTPKYKRIRSSWRAALRVVSSGTLVDHDHRVQVDEDTGELALCPEGCPHLSLTLDEFLTLLIQASLPPEYGRGTAVAIDGTDVESHTRPHRKCVDSQGRAFWSVDHDARWGHRTATDRRPTELFHGYEAHVATYPPASAKRRCPSWPQVSRCVRACVIGHRPCSASWTACPTSERACWTAATQPRKATSSPAHSGTAASRSRWTCTRHSVASARAQLPE